MTTGPELDAAGSAVGAESAGDAAAGAVARVFRESSGRAVATLARVFGDISLAEDAVQEAFAVAVERWPSDGLPPNPGGWIVRPPRRTAPTGCPGESPPPAWGRG